MSAPQRPPGCPDEAVDPCGNRLPHDDHTYVWGGPDDYGDYWCPGIESPRTVEAKSP